MSPLFAWMGAILGLLLALSSGVLPGVVAHPAKGSSTSDASSVRQPGAVVGQDPACSAGWGEPDTSRQRSIIASVVTSGVSAWAVGLTTVSEDPRYPLATHWDGASWVDMPIAPSSVERALFGLDRSPTGRLWAVGYRSNASLYYPLMMRWDGSEWDVSPLGDLGGRGGALLSIRARNDAVTWAVGYKVGSSGQRPLAIRRVGAEWKQSSPSVASSATGVLMDIDARNGHDAWAVGWLADRSAPQPYVTHWDGTRWTAMRPELSGSEGALTSVAMIAPDGAWAVGYRIVAGMYKPMVQHWDGQRWRMSPFADVDSDVALLRGVQIGADGQPVAVGTRWDAATGRWRGLVASRSDEGWNIAEVPTMAGGTELRDLATRPDGSAWVVGANGGRSLVTDLCPGPAIAPEVPSGPGTNPGQAIAAVDVPATTPPGVQPATPTTASTPSARPGMTPGPSATHTPSLRVTRGGRVVARDMTEEAGLTLDTATYGAVRADFDSDGWPDLFIGRHSDAGWLTLNDQGHFVSAPGVTIPRRDRHGCTAGDANGDKLPDLYCSNGALHGAGFKGNELYVQRPDGTFVDRAVELRASDPFGRGRLAVFFDLDHDRFDDLFIANRPARTDGLPSRDRVLANPRGRGYIAQSVARIDAAGGADCLRAADLDRDGWEDIVLCERAMDRTDSYGIHILRNDRGHLVDITSTTGIAKRQSVDAIVADMDRDGRPDIVEVTPYQLRIHFRRGTRYDLGYTRPLRDGVAVAAGDVDGDGDRDLYVVQGTRGKQRADEMLLSRGDGRGFRSMSVPRATRGAAESVTSIDYDRNGSTDFLVLNGRGALSSGPVQLIAFFPG